MLTQLPITQNLIDNLYRICNTAEVGLSSVRKLLETMKQDSVYNACVGSMEDSQQSIAAVRDFILRATTDEYGELKK